MLAEIMPLKTRHSKLMPIWIHATVKSCHSVFMPTWLQASLNYSAEFHPHPRLQTYIQPNVHTYIHTYIPSCDVKFECTVARHLSGVNSERHASRVAWMQPDELGVAWIQSDELSRHECIMAWIKSSVNSQWRELRVTWIHSGVSAASTIHTYITISLYIYIYIYMYSYVSIHM